MSRRPTGIRPMTAAERQRRSRELRRMKSALAELRTVGLSPLESDWDRRTTARQRAPGAEGLARAAACELAQMRLDDVRDQHRRADDREKLYLDAREQIAAMLKAEGLNAPVRRAIDMLKRALTVELRVISDRHEDELKPGELWSARL